MEVRAGRRRVRISNSDKVLFPDDGITKADLANYYAAVAPAMVEHTRDRPLNLWRWNRGIDHDVVIDPVVPAPEVQRPVAHVRHHRGRHLGVVAGEILLGDPVSGEQDLGGIADPHPAPAGAYERFGGHAGRDPNDLDLPRAVV